MRRVSWYLGTTILPPILDILGVPSPPCPPTLQPRTLVFSLLPMANQGILKAPVPTPQGVTLRVPILQGVTLRAPIPKRGTPRAPTHRVPSLPTPMDNRKPFQEWSLAVSSEVGVGGGAPGPTS